MSDWAKTFSLSFILRENKLDPSKRRRFFIGNKDTSNTYKYASFSLARQFSYFPILAHFPRPFKAFHHFIFSRRVDSLMTKLLVLSANVCIPLFCLCMCDCERVPVYTFAEYKINIYTHKQQHRSFAFAPFFTQCLYAFYFSSTKRMWLACVCKRWRIKHKLYSTLFSVVSDFCCCFHSDVTVDRMNWTGN